MSDTAPIFRPFAFTAEEAQRFEDELSAFCAAHLTPGVDYGTIPKANGAMLFKPGAEKLSVFLGLAPTIEVLHRDIDWQKGVISYEVKCALVCKRSGLVVAEGVGACNSKERKYANRDAADMANTILKMAKKRAHVDAVLVATGSRFMAEEDVDIEECAPRPQRAPQRAAQSRPAAPARPQQAPAPAPRADGLQCNCGVPCFEVAHPTTGDIYAVCGQARRSCDFKQKLRGNPNPTPPKPTPTLPNTAETPEETQAALQAESDKPVHYEIPDRARWEACACGATITFARTKKGGMMPLNQDGTSHFINCPMAGQFRNRAHGQAAPGSAAAPGLPNYLKALFATATNHGLDCTPASKTARLAAANRTLMAHGKHPVESWRDLDESAAALCIHAIECGAMTWTSPQAQAA